MKIESADFDGLLELARRSSGDDMPQERQHVLHLFEVASRLCDERSFHLALPLAAELVARRPQDHRHSFLLGTCLQRLNNHREAIAPFWLSLALVRTPAAAYRLAECLQREGMLTAAIQAFDIAAAAARGKTECELLRQRARESAWDLAQSLHGAAA